MSREAPSDLILASGGKNTGMPTIAANCDYPEPALLTGFLKSRVYAKLLMRLISERYQTFNSQMEEAEAERCMIPKP